MSRWRWPTLEERERDRRLLESFLRPEVADAIAAMPVVETDVVPWELRARAWLWGAHELLRASRRDRRELRRLRQRSPVAA